MTTLKDVIQATLVFGIDQQGYEIGKGIRDRKVRECYRLGNATLQELAKATGLSKQRIHQIVGEGEA